MSQVVTNPSADKEEKIDHAARLIRSSPQIKEVFLVIYSGRKPYKSIEEIGRKVHNFNNNTHRAVLKLYAEDIVLRRKSAKGRYYEYGRHLFYQNNLSTIVRLSKNLQRLKSYPTKRKVIARVPEGGLFKFLSSPKATRLYVDDINSFQEVKKIKQARVPGIHLIPERTINKGICKILGAGEKNDWGGERNDIFGPIALKGKRKLAAFALKGKATRGTLTLDKMGSRGDQIQRLFESAADVHILVYHDLVHERVYDQMQIMAIHKSVSNQNKNIFYCIVDGKDLARLIATYPAAFK